MEILQTWGIAVVVYHTGILCACTLSTISTKKQLCTVCLSLSGVGYNETHSDLEHCRKTPVLWICFTEEIVLSKSILPATPKGLTLVLLTRLCCCAKWNRRDKWTVQSPAQHIWVADIMRRSTSTTPYPVHPCKAVIPGEGFERPNQTSTFAAQKTAQVEKNVSLFTFH